MTSTSTDGSKTRGSATIYEFPIGGRAGLSTFKPRSLDQARPQPPAEVALTDAWYHQDAIREAQQATKQ